MQGGIYLISVAEENRITVKGMNSKSLYFFKKQKTQADITRICKGSVRIRIKFTTLCPATASTWQSRRTHEKNTLGSKCPLMQFMHASNRD